MTSERLKQKSDLGYCVVRIDVRAFPKPFPKPMRIAHLARTYSRLFALSVRFRRYVSGRRDRIVQ